MMIMPLAKNMHKETPLPPSKEQEAQPTSFTTKEDTLMEETEETKAAEEKKEELNDGDAKPAAAVGELPPRPIKKARTAYFIFADEKRAEIAAKVRVLRTAVRYMSMKKRCLSLTYVRIMSHGTAPRRRSGRCRA